MTAHIAHRVLLMGPLLLGLSVLLFGLIDLRQTMTMYWVVLGIFVLGFLIVYRTIHSPFGQVLKAIRENEPRAVSLGYRPEQYKLIAFVISAALSGAPNDRPPKGEWWYYAGDLASTKYSPHASGNVSLTAR